MGIDPITMLAVAGAATSGIGAMRANQYQGAVAARNSAVAAENARRESVRGQEEQVDWAASAQQQLGAMLAEMTAGGLSTSGGTGLLRKSSAEALSYRDQFRGRQESGARIDADLQQSADFAVESGMRKRAGAFDLFTGALNVTSSIVGGSAATKRRRAAAI